MQTAAPKTHAGARLRTSIPLAVLLGQQRQKKTAVTVDGMDCAGNMRQSAGRIHVAGEMRSHAWFYCGGTSFARREVRTREGTAS